MKVLDMGSGLNPDIRATDAVEIDLNKGNDIKIDEKSAISQAIDMGVSKEKIKNLQSHRNNRIKILFGINYNSKLPYADNTFDIVTSHSSMIAICYGKIKSYQEAYRILKNGGILEICAASGWDPAMTKHAVNHMKQSGFKGLSFKRNVQDSRLFFSKLSRMKNDILYGVKP